jgi:methylase of polypeptide subunit release factors
MCRLPSQRFELFHRMIRFVFGNKIYVGPVEKVLSPDRDNKDGERLRVLDMGTGSGLW